MLSGDALTGDAGPVHRSAATMCPANSAAQDAARALVASGDARGADVRYWAALDREWSPVDISDLEAIVGVP
jgi:hypothetical protein